MQQRKLERVGFVELLDGVGYPVVKGWLGLLLGGFELGRSGGFYYREGVLVRLKYQEFAESLCGAIAYVARNIAT